MKLLEAALLYASRGWHVFPCEPGGKAPFGRTVRRGHLDATTDIAQIKAWWDVFPESNVGIALAPSGLVALDVDVAEGKPGKASLLEIDAELSDTLTATTGRGGLHVIYTRPSDMVGTRKIGFKPGLDLLGDGYIVAAPSRLREGGVYAWSRDIAPTPLPQILRDAAIAPRPSAEKVGSVGSVIDHGGRNNALFRLGAALRDTGIGAEALARALDAENQQRFKPPVDDGELKAIIDSVLRRVTPSRDVAAGAVVEEEIHEMFPWKPPAPARTAVVEYGTEPLRDYLGDDDPGDAGDDWIIQGLVATGVAQMTVGHPKSYKTFLMEYLAICVALGLPAFGRPDHFATKRGRVLILPHEDSLRETRRRIWRLARAVCHQAGTKFDPRELDEWLRIDTMQPFYWTDQAHVDALRRTIDQRKLSMLVIDSFSRSHMADESSAQEMGPVMNNWADICLTSGVAISQIHHYTKAAQGSLLQNIRGSGSLGAAARQLIGVEKAAERGEPFELSFDGNLHPLPDPFRIQMKDGFNADKQKIISFEYAGASTAGGGAKARAADTRAQADAMKLIARVREEAAGGGYYTPREWRTMSGLPEKRTDAAWALAGPGGMKQLAAVDTHPVRSTRAPRGGMYVVLGDGEARTP